MAITFAVDDVRPLRAKGSEARELARRRTVAEAFEVAVGTRPLTVSHEAALIVDEGSTSTHPLVSAVHRAFARHRPLILTPDAIWLTLAGGFATHIESEGAILRGRLVRHEGRAPVTVQVMAQPTTAAGWQAVVARFCDGLEPHVGPGLHRLLRCDFSTTDAVARTASQAVMMAALRRYFEYGLECVCGIPQITLEGTPDDWRDIRRRLDIFAEYGLEWWIDRLAPVADAWVRTAEGRPDRTFWQCIYKPASAYGGDVITGWLSRLFPYAAPGHRNRNFGPDFCRALVESRQRGTPVVQLLGADEQPIPPEHAPWVDDGINTGSMPGGLSAARLRTMQRPDPREEPIPDGSVMLVGGLIGATITDDGAVRPEPGWAVCEPDHISRLIEAIRSNARTRACDEALYVFRAMSAAEHAFRAEIGEAWLSGVHLRATPDMDTVPIDAGKPRRALSRIADLGTDDARWLGLDEWGRVALVDPLDPLPFGDLPRVAEDFGDLLERLVRSGRWFDAPDFTPLGRLSDRAPADGRPDWLRSL